MQYIADTFYKTKPKIYLRINDLHIPGIGIYYLSAWDDSTSFGLWADHNYLHLDGVIYRTMKNDEGIYQYLFTKIEAIELAEKYGYEVIDQC